MNGPVTRIDRRFTALAREGRAGLVTFVTAGDPDADTSAAIVAGLAGAGADLIELGMPFTDPMADGPAIQAAGQRALKAGQTMRRTLAMVAALRRNDDDTPVILMGYFNPIHHYGVDAFLADAGDAGVDGLIVVDLPPEEDAALCAPAMTAGISFIRLVSPATGPDRIKQLVANSSGFIYYVSIAGITGTRSAVGSEVAQGIARIRGVTDLPVAIGFGIRTAAQAAEMAGVGNAVVVGSAIVQRIADGCDESGRPKPGLTESVLGFVSELARGVRGASGDPEQEVAES